MLEMAQTVIHESLHLAARGFSDALLGEVISGKPITGTDSERRIKGSTIISEAIAKNCK
jgi:hypothetical protein